MEKMIDPKKLRKVAGAFATGVTVVTTAREDGSIHGMTANSFLSVSLAPPLVAFSVRNEGSLMKHLALDKPLGISILSDQQEGISNQFAGQNDSAIEVQFEQHSNGISTIKDCMAWYCTKIHQILPAGDHYLILCEVLDLDRLEHANPLLYYSGYQTLAS